MSVVAQCLVESQYGSITATLVYTTPASTHTIIDKFTAQNSDGGGTHTVTVWLVPSAGSTGNSNLLLNAVSIAASAVLDSAVMQNQILNPGDSIYVQIDAGNVVSIRCSGRQVQ